MNVKEQDVFHLAIPCADLDATRTYYVEQLGCQLAREYPDRLCLNFFGAQIVTHLAPKEIDEDPKMYPRHFGVTTRSAEDFEGLLAKAREFDLPFFQEPVTRWKGRPDEHRTFFLRDPSNNLLEFKLYKDAKFMY